MSAHSLLSFEKANGFFRPARLTIASVVAFSRLTSTSRSRSKSLHSPHERKGLTDGMDPGFFRRRNSSRLKTLMMDCRIMRSYFRKIQPHLRPVCFLWTGFFQSAFSGCWRTPGRLACPHRIVAFRRRIDSTLPWVSPSKSE